MIPAGSKLVTQQDIAELHGLSIHQARRAAPPPWAQSKHPKPLTTGKPTRARPMLWDAEQAAAYALGKPVPALPELGHPKDLLDRDEAASLAGLTSATWLRYENAEQGRTREPDDSPLVPPADETHAGMPFWYRRTVETYRDERAQAGRKRGGGRPAGTSETTPRAELAARVAELAAERDDNGNLLSIADIARRLGVHYTTAHKHVTAAREQNPVAPDQQRT